MVKKLVLLLVITAVCFIPAYAGADMELKLDKEIYTGLSDEMKITLTAPSKNKNARMAETAAARVYTSNNSFGINIVLSETGKDTGIFTGSVRFSFGSTSAEERVIGVGNDTRLYVQCEGLTDEAIWIPFNADIGLDKDEYRGLGDFPKITLTDHDLNTLPNAVEKVQVHVKSTSDPQGIYMMLEETSADSGVFTGYLKLTTGHSDSGKNMLHIEYNDKITVIYNDVTNLNSLGKLCTASALWKPQTAEVKFNRNSFSGLNSNCKVTVTDKDMNRDMDSRDVVDVKVVSDADPEGILVKLIETKENSGIFTADISFSRYSSNSGWGVLKVGAETKLKAIYHDEWNEDNKRNTYVEGTAVFRFVEGTISTTCDDKDEYDISRKIVITVKDPDEDTNDQKNTLQVIATSDTSPEGLTLWLEETGKSSGSFKGTLYFSTKPVRDKDRKDVTLLVKQGDEVKITYRDTTVPEGEPKLISKQYYWSHQKARLEFDKESYSGYNTAATITVYDSEANRDSREKDKVRVKVTGSPGSELNMILEETEADSGVFEGKVYFAKEEDRKSDKIAVKNGDKIYAAYQDQGDYNFGIIEAKAEWKPYDAEIKLDRETYYGNNAGVIITVKDLDMDFDPDSRDIVTVTVGIEGRPETAFMLSLKETGKNTGIFKDNIALNGSGSNRLKFSIKDGERLEVRYIDRDNTSDVSVERKATAIWKQKK